MMNDTDKLISILGRFTAKDAFLVQKLSKEQLTAYEFNIKLIESKLGSLNAPSESTYSWSDDFLLEVMLGWLRKNEMLADELADIVTLETLQATLIDYVVRQTEKMRASFEKLYQNEIFNVAKQLQGIVRTFEPPHEQIQHLMSSLVKDVTGLKGDFFSPAGIFAKSNDLIDHRFIANIFNVMQGRADELGAAQSALKSLAFTPSPMLDAARLSANISLSSIAEHLGAANALHVETLSVQMSSLIAPITSLLNVAEMSTFAQTSLAHISMDNIGAAIGFNKAYQKTLEATFSLFTDAYSVHIQSLGKITADIIAFQPFIIEAPGREFFAASNLIEAISSEQVEDDLSEDRAKKITRFAEQNENTLYSFLRDLDPRLIVMHEGAITSLMSDNPDRLRHFGVSLRELFTHVLHTLAPDAAVATWTNDPTHFHNGNPTRKARMLFICRAINSPPLIQFFKKDIDATLELLDVFQKVTHEVAVQMSENQLIAIKLKMESAIRFILEADKWNQ